MIDLVASVVAGIIIGLTITYRLQGFFVFVGFVLLFFACKNQKKLIYILLRCSIFYISCFLISSLWIFRKVFFFSGYHFAITLLFFLLVFFAYFSPFFFLGLFLWKFPGYKISNLFIVASGFAICEYIFSRILPYNFVLGYAFSNGTLFWLIPIVGAHGLSFIIIFGSLLIVYSFNFEKRRYFGTHIVFVVIFFLFLFLPNLFYGPSNQSPKAFSTLRVSLLQDSFEKTELPQFWKKLEDLENLSLKASKKEELVVWPESSIPIRIEKFQYVVDALLKFAKKNNAYFMFGAEGINKSNNKIRYNSVYVISNEGKIMGRYDKILPFPFFEYIPFENWLRKLGITRLFSFFRGLVKRGKEIAVFKIKDFKFSPFLCSEVLYPDLFRKAKNKGADFFVVLAREADFDKAMSFQILNISRMRAMESQTPLIRVNNTGFTSIILGNGKIEAMLPYGVKDSLSGVLPLNRTKPTFYDRFGILPLVVIFVGAFVLKL